MEITTTLFALRDDCVSARNGIAKIEALVEDNLFVPAELFHSAARVQLAFARGWLGKALGSLGEETPYPQSDNPESQVIEPPAYEKMKANIPDQILVSVLISEIKRARKEIAEYVELLGFWPVVYERPGFGRYVSLSKTALEAARLMLGEELGVIRDYREQSA